MWLKDLSNETLALLYELHAGGYHDSKLIEDLFTKLRNGQKTLLSLSGSILSDSVVMQVTDDKRDSIIQELIDLGVTLKSNIASNTAYAQGDLVLDQDSVVYRVQSVIGSSVKLKRITDGVVVNIHPNKTTLLKIPAFVFNNNVSDDNKLYLEQIGAIYDTLTIDGYILYVGNLYVGDNAFAADLIKRAAKNETNVRE